MFSITFLTMCATTNLSNPEIRMSQLILIMSIVFASATIKFSNT